MPQIYDVIEFILNYHTIYSSSHKGARITIQ